MRSVAVDVFCLIVIFSVTSARLAGKELLGHIKVQ